MSSNMYKIYKRFFGGKKLDGVDDPDIPTSEIVNILDRAALSANKNKNLRKKQIIVSGLSMI